MFSITATLGRNYSDRVIAARGETYAPTMTITRWEQFIEDVEHDMAAAVRGAQPTLMITEQHRGKGEWNGVEEESCKVTILADFAAYPTDVIGVITGYLRSLSWQYGQDAIALTVGVSELISATNPTQRVISDEEQRMTHDWDLRSEFAD